MCDQRESDMQNINILAEAQFKALCDDQLKSCMKDDILPRTVLLMREAMKYQRQIEEVLNEIKKLDHVVGLLHKYQETFLYQYGFLPKPPSRTIGINVDFTFPENGTQEETDVKPDLLYQHVLCGSFVCQEPDCDSFSTLVSEFSVSKLDNKQEEQGEVGIKGNIVTSSSDTDGKQQEPKKTCTDESSSAVKPGDASLLNHQQNKLVSKPVATTAVTTVQNGTTSSAPQAYLLCVPNPESDKNMSGVKLMLNPAKRLTLRKKFPFILPKPEKKPSTVTNNNVSHRQKQMPKVVQVKKTVSGVFLPQSIKNLISSNAKVSIISKVITPGESIAKIVKLPTSSSASSVAVSVPTGDQQKEWPKSLVKTRGKAVLEYSPRSTFPSISIQELYPFPEKSKKSLPAKPDSPPKPVLKVSNVFKGISIHWKLALTPFHDQIKLFQVCVKDTDCKEDKWKIVGVINALPWGGKYKACTLSEFVKGQCYSFALRAVDVCFRKGPLSNEVSMTVTPPEDSTSR